MGVLHPDVPVQPAGSGLGLPALAEPREARPRCRGLFGIGRGAPAKLQHGRWRVPPGTEHAEAVAVQELEGRITLRQLGPEPPDAEIKLALVGVVEQHDRAVGELGQPGLEIVPDSLVGVHAVDVQQVHAAVGELAERLVERAAQQLGERRESLIVVVLEVGEHVLAVVPGVLVTLPGIDREAARAQPLCLYGLAESGVGDAGVRPELHQQPGPGRAHEPLRERHMSEPRAVAVQPLGPAEQGRERRIGERAERRIVQFHGWHRSSGPASQWYQAPSPRRAPLAAGFRPDLTGAVLGDAPARSSAIGRGGGGWIRTNEGIRRRIYSPLP